MFYILDLLFNIATGIIILQVALSWLVAFGIVNADNDAAQRLMNGLAKVTDPVYRPLRKFIPPIGGIDLTPLVVLIGLGILRQILFTLLVGGAY